MQTHNPQNFTTLGEPVNLNLASVILSPPRAFPEIMRSRVNPHRWRKGSQGSPPYRKRLLVAKLNGVNLWVNLQIQGSPVGKPQFKGMVVLVRFRGSKSLALPHFPPPSTDVHNVARPATMI